MRTSGRRPIVRWAWRLFKRDWRQQMLVIGLMVFSVAFVLYATVAVSNALSVNEGEFGHAQAVISFKPRSAQQLSETLAALEDHLGGTEVIGHRGVAVPGAVEMLDFAAQKPGGALGAPMLKLRQGRYPTSADEIALTDGAAELLRVRLGAEFTFDRATRRVVGIVQNPSQFDDEFALASPGGIVPDSVTVLTKGDFFDEGTLPAVPGQFTVMGRGDNDSAAAAALTLLVSAVLLLLIALVAAAGFAAVAQRRLRQLGMLSAVGASDKHLRLVMVANGTLVGGVAAVVGLVIAAAVWLVTRAPFERLVGHEIAGLGVQWWVVLTAFALALVTATAAAWWPARGASRVPVVEALSGRPPQPSAARRSVVLALVLLAGGLVTMQAGVDVTADKGNPFLLIGGALALVVGVLLFAPLSIRGAAKTVGRAPVAFRLALRDLSRYQARSGAALAAISLGLGIAVSTIVVSAANEYRADEGNLADNHLLLRTRNDFIASENQAAARSAVENLARTVPGATLFQLDAILGGTEFDRKKGEDIRPPMALARRINERSARFLTNLYWSPELLDHIGADDYAAVDVFAVHTGALRIEPLGRDAPIPRVRHYDAPEFSAVPTALVTPAGMARYGFDHQPVGWFLEAREALTGEQVAAARDAAASVGLFAEVRDEQGSLRTTRAIATGVGALVALCLLALTIGLIRSEAGRDLQTLVATGATSFTRRALTAATSGVLALLGSALAIVGSYAALVAIYLDRPGDLASVPFIELACLLFGLPIVAAAAGWLVTGREPPVIVRHVLD